MLHVCERVGQSDRGSWTLALEGTQVEAPPRPAPRWPFNGKPGAWRMAASAAALPETHIATAARDAQEQLVL